MAPHAFVAGCPCGGWPSCSFKDFVHFCLQRVAPALLTTFHLGMIDQPAKGMGRMRGAAGCENSARPGFLLLACRNSQIGCPCVDNAYLLTTAERAANEMAASNAGPAWIICHHTARVARERKRRTALSYLSKWINVPHKSPKRHAPLVGSKNVCSVSVSREMGHGKPHPSHAA